MPWPCGDVPPQHCLMQGGRPHPVPHRSPKRQKSRWQPRSSAARPRFLQLLFWRLQPLEPSSKMGNLLLN